MRFCFRPCESGVAVLLRTGEGKEHFESKLGSAKLCIISLESAPAQCVSRWIPLFGVEELHSKISVVIVILSFASTAMLSLRILSIDAEIPGSSQPNLWSIDLKRSSRWAVGFFVVHPSQSHVHCFILLFNFGSPEVADWTAPAVWCWCCCCCCCRVLVALVWFLLVVCVASSSSTSSQWQYQYVYIYILYIMCI